MAQFEYYQIKMRNGLNRKRIRWFIKTIHAHLSAKLILKVCVKVCWIHKFHLLILYIVGVSSNLKFWKVCEKFVKSSKHVFIETEIVTALLNSQISVSFLTSNFKLTTNSTSTLTTNFNQKRVLSIRCTRFQAKAGWNQL